MEATRAQQLENWQNQQEVLRARHDHRFMTDDFDQIGADEDWRKLASFGVERNQDFDLDATFGPVRAGDRIEGTIELQGRLNRFEVHEFAIKNSFMGFSDFRAAFTPDTNTQEWSVSPSEGSLSGKKDTAFVVKYRAQSIGASAGYLVIDTEDYKWTWRLLGTGSM
jgi:hypothetical protein